MLHEFFPHWFPIAISLFSFVGYFFTNRRRSRYNFSTFIDKKVPVLPIFVVPYVLFFPYIIFTYIFLSTAVFVDFLVALTFANVIATAFWFLVPNGVSRPALSITSSRDYFRRLINTIYSHDGDTNGFPSGHVFITLICSWYIGVDAPQLIVPVVLMALLISFSTIFTKQHYVIDILGGIGVALLSISVTLLF